VRLALRPTIPAEARRTADGATHATRQRTNGDGIDCGAGFAGPVLFRPAALSKRGTRQGASDDLGYRTQETRPLQASGGQRFASRPAASGCAREGRHGAPRRCGRPATRLTRKSALPRAALGHSSAHDTRRIAFSSLPSAFPPAARGDDVMRRSPDPPSDAAHIPAAEKGYPAQLRPARETLGPRSPARASTSLEGTWAWSRFPQGRIPPAIRQTVRGRPPRRRPASAGRRDRPLGPPHPPSPGLWRTAAWCCARRSSRTGWCSWSMSPLRVRIQRANPNQKDAEHPRSWPGLTPPLGAQAQRPPYAGVAEVASDLRKRCMENVSGDRRRERGSEDADRGPPDAVGDRDGIHRDRGRDEDREVDCEPPARRAPLRQAARSRGRDARRARSTPADGGSGGAPRDASACSPAVTRTGRDLTPRLGGIDGGGRRRRSPSTR
jgi:hypothetical protein